MNTDEKLNTQSKEIHELIGRLLAQFADENLKPIHVMIASAHIAGLIAGAKNFPVEVITMLAQIAMLVSKEDFKAREEREKREFAITQELRNFKSDIMS